MLNYFHSPVFTFVLCHGIQEVEFSFKFACFCTLKKLFNQTTIILFTLFTHDLLTRLLTGCTSNSGACDFQRLGEEYQVWTCGVANWDKIVHLLSDDSCLSVSHMLDFSAERSIRVADFFQFGILGQLCRNHVFSCFFSYLFVFSVLLCFSCYKHVWGSCQVPQIHKKKVVVLSKHLGMLLFLREFRLFFCKTAWFSLEYVIAYFNFSQPSSWNHQLQL